MTEQRMKTAIGKCLAALTSRGFRINKITGAVTGSWYIQAAREFGGLDIELTIRLADHQTPRRVDYDYDVFAEDSEQQFVSYLDRIC
jgi:hypothetical protein